MACSSRQYTAPFASPMDVPACSWTPASIMGYCFPPAVDSCFPSRGDTRSVPRVCECNVAFLTRGKRTGALRYALTGGVRTPSSLYHCIQCLREENGGVSTSGTGNREAAPIHPPLLNIKEDSQVSFTSREQRSAPERGRSLSKMGFRTKLRPS